MKKIIKIELLELVTSPFLYVVAIVLFACTNILPIVVGSYTSIDRILIDICKNIAAPLIASGAYIGLAHSLDFKKGLVRLYISSGIKRGQIVFAKFIHSVMASLIVLLMDIFLSMLLLSIYQKQFLIENLIKCLKLVCYIFPFWIAIVSIFQFIAIIAQYAAINVSLIMLVVFVTTAITNIFKNSSIIRSLPLYGITTTGSLAGAWSSVWRVSRENVSSSRNSIRG